MSKILVVDDEPQILRSLVLSLVNRGFEVSTTADARTALGSITSDVPDLVLLDLGLPDLDGLEVIRRLHDSRPTLPILVLSARSGGADKITALDLGAIDYVTKPFEIDELLARVRAALRRTAGTHTATRAVQIGDNHIDLDARLVTRTESGETTAVHLTRTEWRMLEMLLDAPGALVAARDLLTELRGDADHTESSYLRIYMAQLRRKLEPEPSRPRHLVTEPGMGYRYQP